MPIPDPSAVHAPVDGAVAPAAWGAEVNAAIDQALRPQMVRVHRATNFSIAHVTTVSIPWDDTLFDDDDMHSTSTNPSRLTAQVPGRYEVAATVVFDADSTGARLLGLWKRHGETDEFRFDRDVDSNPGASQVTVLRVSGTVDLDAGDWVEVRARQESGSSLDVIGSSDGDESFFRAEWRGR